MTRRSVYLIELQGTSDHDIHALRALLKALGRWHGLRCLSARERSRHRNARGGAAAARASIAATKEANMAIGRRKTDGALNKLNWDFRIGKPVLEDRVRTGNGWETEQRNLETDEFRAVFDPENIEVGWIAFVKGEGLNATLVHAGEDYGDRPSNDHKEGLRIVVKMDPALGGDLRELISTSSALWSAVDQLHSDYSTDVAKHPNCLPVVDIADVQEQPTQSGAILVPTFKISGWVPRPPDLPAMGIPLFRRKK